LFNWTAGIWTTKEKLCGIGNVGGGERKKKSPLNAKVKLLKAEILYLTVHYKNNSDDDNIPGKHKIKEPQKLAILGTARILQKALT